MNQSAQKPRRRAATPEWAIYLPANELRALDDAGTAYDAKDYRTGTAADATCSRVKAIVDAHQGGFTMLPDNWRGKIVLPNGNFDVVACDLLAWLMRMCQPFRDKSGKWRLRERIRHGAFYVSLEYIRLKLGYGVRTLRHAFRRLSSAELLNYDEDVRWGCDPCYAVTLDWKGLADFTLVKPVADLPRVNGRKRRTPQRDNGAAVASQPAGAAVGDQPPPLS